MALVERIPASTLPPRRAMLLEKILFIWLWISVPMLAALVIATILLRFPYQLVAMAVSTILLSACLVWTRKNINKAYFTQSILGLVLVLLLISSGVGLLFPNGVTALLLAIIISLLILSLAGMSRAIPWMTGLGTVVLLILSIVEQFELAEFWKIQANIITKTFIPSLLVVGLIILGMFIYLLNDSLSQSLHESEERRGIAEATQAEQAIMLKQVQEQSREQSRLLELVHDLETPVIPVMDGVLVLPLVGHLDSARLNHLSQHLLERVAAERAQTVLIDLTAVSVIDTATANHLLQLTKGVRLLGAECILTGIRAEVAQTLVALGVTWESVPTAASLRDALAQLQDQAKYHD